MRELLDKEQRCEVARSAASVFTCKEGGQTGSCHIYSSVFEVHGGIAQLVERLVRNEKARGSNPLTSRPEMLSRLSVPIFSEVEHLSWCNLNAASCDSEGINLANRHW